MANLDESGNLVITLEIGDVVRLKGHQISMVVTEFKPAELTLICGKGTDLVNRIDELAEVTVGWLDSQGHYQWKKLPADCFSKVENLA